MKYMAGIITGFLAAVAVDIWLFYRTNYRKV